MRLKAGIVAALAIAGVAAAQGQVLPGLDIVAVDPLQKVFRETPADQLTTAATMECARGETASFQLVVKGALVDLSDLRCTATAFRGPGELQTAAVRAVGYVGSSISATKPASSRQLRPAPAMYPDPLIPTTSTQALAGCNQPFWITVSVPTGAAPGRYDATASISARRLGVETSATARLQLDVTSATVTGSRLNVAQWYQMNAHGDYPMPARYTDEWFAMLKGYVASMTSHGINWGWIETFSAMHFRSGDDGEMLIDFSDFDRWMETLLSGGMKMVEGQHYAFRMKGWTGPFGVKTYALDGGEWRPETVAPDTWDAQNFAAWFFPQFQDHLEEKGWLDKYVQHVADEPLDKNADSYTTAARLMKEWAPKLRIMEACQTQKVAGLVDIWIPQLDHFAKGYDFFQQRQAAGDEVWFYTCMYPQGDYANRFIELPLVETRLLHWMNFHYNATGYLHWGWNWWPPHPYEDAAQYSMMQLPAGDSNIVYPEPGGPGVWDSIRYEAMRDGIYDYELLCQLKEKNPNAAARIAGKLIRGFTDYNEDIATFRAARRELLGLLSN